MANDYRITTSNKVRFNFPHVFEPHAFVDGAPERYSCQLIIHKDDRATLEAIDRAMRAAYEEQGDRIAKSTAARPAFEKLQNPLHDGDIERADSPEFAGCYYINAKSNQRPTVVDRNNQTIIDAEEIYSGCYGNAAIFFYCYAAGSNKGIACGLNGLRKTREGERLDGNSRSAQSLFGDACEDDDDDFLS